MSKTNYTHILKYAGLFGSVQILGLLLLAVVAVSEDGGADADDGGAFGDGDLEVA